jgi:hypothetical protein
VAALGRCHPVSVEHQEAPRADEFVSSFWHHRDGELVAEQLGIRHVDGVDRVTVIDVDQRSGGAIYSYGDRLQRFLRVVFGPLGPRCVVIGVHGPSSPSRRPGKRSRMAQFCRTDEELNRTSVRYGESFVKHTAPGLATLHTIQYRSGDQPVGQVGERVADPV